MSLITLTVIGRRGRWIGPRQRLGTQDVLTRTDVVRCQAPTRPRRTLRGRDTDGHKFRPVAVIDATQPIKNSRVKSEQRDDTPRNCGTVGDSNERLIGTARGRSLHDRVAYTFPHDLRTLNVGALTLTSRTILRICLRLLGGDLLVGFPLEGAVETFRKPLVGERTFSGVSRNVKHSKENACSLAGSPQRRADDAYSPIIVYGHCLSSHDTDLRARLAQATHEYACSTRRLGPAHIVQRLIDVPLETTLEVKVRLSMTQQNDA